MPSEGVLEVFSRLHNGFREHPTRRSSVSRGMCCFGFVLLFLLLATSQMRRIATSASIFAKASSIPRPWPFRSSSAPQPGDDLDVGHRILQFDQIRPSLGQLVQARGITLLRHIPNNAYWVSVDRPLKLTDAEHVTGDVLLSWQPDAFFRVSEEISGGKIPPHATNPDGVSEILVLVFEDVGQSEAESAFRGVPGVEIVEWQSPEMVLLRLPPERIAEVAELDLTHWLEPRPPPNVTYNVTAAARIGVNVLQNPPYSLDGSGVGVWHFGRRTH